MFALYRRGSIEKFPSFFAARDFDGGRGAIQPSSIVL
jgi:hypothetical protein